MSLLVKKIKTEQTKDGAGTQKENGEEALEMKCRICEHIEVSIEGYILHQPKHFSKDRMKYLCNLCPYSSVVRDHFRKHLMRHYNIKPFKCSKCDWTCVTKYQLQQHTMSHHLNLNPNRKHYERTA